MVDDVAEAEAVEPADGRVGRVAEGYDHPFIGGDERVAEDGDRHGFEVSPGATSRSRSQPCNQFRRRRGPVPRSDTCSIGGDGLHRRVGKRDRDVQLRRSRVAFNDGSPRQDRRCLNVTRPIERLAETLHCAVGSGGDVLWRTQREGSEGVVGDDPAGGDPSDRLATGVGERRAR